MSTEPCRARCRKRRANRMSSTAVVHVSGAIAGTGYLIRKKHISRWPQQSRKGKSLRLPLGVKRSSPQVDRPNRHDYGIGENTLSALSDTLYTPRVEKPVSFILLPDVKQLTLTAYLHFPCIQDTDLDLCRSIYKSIQKFRGSTIAGSEYQSRNPG
jgi:hypothetical protein